MSETSEVPVVEGWVERLQKLNAILRQAYSTTEEIFGSTPTTSDTGKESACIADQLTDELTSALDSAKSLADQLMRLRGRF